MAKINAFNVQINEEYLKYNELLKALIRFDTSNPPGNEYECIEYIKKYLELEGFSCEIFSKHINRPNLITKLKGRSSAKPLLFFCHIDVVKAGNEEWKFPPFEGREEQGYIWGRGAVDMKGSAAMMIASLIEAKKQKIVPDQDIILIVLSDEESGSEYGAEYIVKNHADLFKNVKYAIGEFGGFPYYSGRNKFYQIQVSEKTLCRLKIILKGKAGHASINIRNGIIYKLAWILLKLNNLKLPVYISEPVKLMIKSFADNMSFPAGFFVSLLLKPFFTKFILFVFKKKFGAFKPFLFNTVNVTRVITKNEINVIPDVIEIHLDCRLLPGQSSNDFIKFLKNKIDKNMHVEIILSDDLTHKVDLGLYDLLSGILKEIDPEGIPMPMVLTGCSDARLFSKLGIQCYGFTPMNLPEDCNVLKLVHSVNERLPVSAVPFGINALLKLIKRYK